MSIFSGDWLSINAKFWKASKKKSKLESLTIAIKIQFTFWQSIFQWQSILQMFVLAGHELRAQWLVAAVNRAGCSKGRAAEEWTWMIVPSVLKRANCEDCPEEMNN